MRDAGYTPLTPLAFLERSATVFPDKVAIVHGERRLTYEDFAAHAVRLAHALRASGVRQGDRVAYLCPNIPELLIAHYAVPLAGGVLVAVNTRLAPAEVRYICEHSESKLLVADTELASTVEPVASDLTTVEEIVWAEDVSDAPAGLTYDELLTRGTDEPLPFAVEDEQSTITINYTSGTTGRPKGVMYSHRGAFLNSLGETIHSGFTPQTVYLWTLPMFHCNGWCTTWAVTGIGGTHVCLRAVRPDVIWPMLTEQGITHLNAAPTVLVGLANAPEAKPLDHELVITTAGAPPSPTIIAQMEELGARIVHVYGLTEVYGPYTVCEWQDGWEELSLQERARLQARQGVAMIISDPVRVVDDDLNDVPRDGQTIGEIVMSGNNVMRGYFKDTEGTQEAFRGRVFHSGDLGVMYPDAYVELRDRAKDVVISGGENISTIEVEQALEDHPDVLECAVIGVPDEKWGERPKAFVVLKRGASATEQELIQHCRGLIAGYKLPKAIAAVEELPKTSTGKIQKFELREREWAGHERRIH